MWGPDESLPEGDCWVYPAWMAEQVETVEACSQVYWSLAVVLVTAMEHAVLAANYNPALACTRIHLFLAAVLVLIPALVQAGYLRHRNCMVATMTATILQVAAFAVALAACHHHHLLNLPLSLHLTNQQLSL